MSSLFTTSKTPRNESNRPTIPKIPTLSLDIKCVKIGVKSGIVEIMIAPAVAVPLLTQSSQTKNNRTVRRMLL